MTFTTKFNDEIQLKMISLINSSLLKTMYERKILLEAQSNTLGVINYEDYRLF
jgi:hypothetical protein